MHSYWLQYNALIPIYHKPTTITVSYGVQLSTMKHCFLERSDRFKVMTIKCHWWWKLGSTGNGRILKTKVSSRNKMCKRNWMHRKLSVLVCTVHLNLWWLLTQIQTADLFSVQIPMFIVRFSIRQCMSEHFWKCSFSLCWKLLSDVLMFYVVTML